MRNILFICTGNTCRSSMAEALFNTAVANDSTLTDQYRSISAGINTVDGQCASPFAVESLMYKWSISLHSHRSKYIDTDDILNSYLILTMTCGHRNAIIELFPQAADRVFTLKEYIADQPSSNNMCLDIIDPFGMPLDVYQTCAEEIKSCVDMLVERLKNI